MGRLVAVKFGPRITDVDVENKKFSDLPGILAALHDTEVPDNVEIFADNQAVKDLNEFVGEGINSIDLTAVAGRKQR